MDPREVAYDTEMYPLVAQLIEIAKRARIPLILSAGMRDAEGGEMGCTTLVLFGKGEPDQLKGIENRFGLSLGIIRGHSGFDTAEAMMITRHHAPDPEGDE